MTHSIKLESFTKDNIKHVFRHTFAMQCQQGTRTFARQPQVPSPEEHEVWLRNRLSRYGSSNFWLAWDSSDQYVLPLGSIRFDGSELAPEVSLIVSEPCRNMGYGKAILRAFLRLHPRMDFSAYIHEQNYASRHCFQACGFTYLGAGWWWNSHNTA